jgi:NTP pyrophosphatase (non-canonical NTP hydrolase)
LDKNANLQTLAEAVESVSARYAERFGISRDLDWCILKLTEELGELTQAHLKRSGRARTEAQDSELSGRFQDEMADVLGQLLVLAKLSGTDLYAALDRKWLRWHPSRISEEAYRTTPPDKSLERTRER